jgi:stress-induced morphogen
MSGLSHPFSLNFRSWFGLCIVAVVAAGVNAMAMAGPDIELLIKQAFPDAQVIVVDLAGDGDHYGARVTSAAFVGKSRIQQHQMVYNALQGHMGGALHALALETAVPK